VWSGVVVLAVKWWCREMKCQPIVTVLEDGRLALWPKGCRVHAVQGAVNLRTSPY